MSFKTIAWNILRVVCYLALAIVAAGIISLSGVFALDLCKQSGGTVTCSDPFYRKMYEFGFTVVLMSVFTGLPALLAIGGLVFAVRDIFWRSR